MEYFSNISYSEVAALAVFLAAIVVQLLFYRAFLVHLRKWIGKEVPISNHPVSVIICAKNDRLQLEQNLHSVLEQAHPEFEVIVVNDRSFDGTKDWLNEQSHHRLKIMHIDPDAQGPKGKKYALTLGIKSAKYERILLTDADCRPASTDWISGMTAALTNDRDLVIGYGAYAKKSSAFNYFERFDTFYKAMLMFGMAASGRPYMAVGRNLMYRKELFFAQGGFKGHMHLRSGDDDLFVNRAANKENTALCIHKEAITISTPSAGAGQWFRRKKRHFTTGAHYKFMDKFLLSAYSFSAMLCWVGIFSIYFFKISLFIVLGAFLLRMLVQIHIFSKSMKELGDRDLLLVSPVLELLVLIMDPIIILSNIIARPQKWK